MADQQFENTQGLSVNKTFAPAPGFWPALAVPQSQNSLRRPATPGVLLNPRDQINLALKNPVQSFKNLICGHALIRSCVQIGC